MTLADADAKKLRIANEALTREIKRLRKPRQITEAMIEAARSIIEADSYSSRPPDWKKLARAALEAAERARVV